MYRSEGASRLVSILLLLWTTKETPSPSSSVYLARGVCMHTDIGYILNKDCDIVLTRTRHPFFSSASIMRKTWKGTRVLNWVERLVVFLSLSAHLSHMQSCQGTPLFTARAAALGKAVPLPEGVSVAPSVPDSPNEYSLKHPTRINKFSTSIISNGRCPGSRRFSFEFGTRESPNGLHHSSNQCCAVNVVLVNSHMTTVDHQRW
jgi:hypothetical protein